MTEQTARTSSARFQTTCSSTSSSLRAAAAAARTSVLARRWRGLWAIPPKLTFADGIEHHRVVAALAAHKVRDLRRLRVATRQASVEHLAVWLPVAARRLTGSMLLRVVWREDDAGLDAELEPEQRGAVLLPCFQRATAVTLEFAFLRLVLPPSGVFARLKVVKLVGIHLYGQCSLGDASLPALPIVAECQCQECTWSGQLHHPFQVPLRHAAAQCRGTVAPGAKHHLVLYRRAESRCCQHLSPPPQVALVDV
ncbi:hypothetical protein ZWY2020_024658 [Hordeum vulgare]|nr:hypothetical protein ZWY2020_024658 [Hordeum vulgare]